mmetsp:Transcript_5027/g.19331  ORF Transcript_5027/g.19331 Transcript_5027/m.19331 type:complete len:245 (+) Transcript_5027:319-1053(+)
MASAAASRTCFLSAKSLMTAFFLWSSSGKCATAANMSASTCFRTLICFQRRKKMEPADFSAASGHNTLGAYVCQIPFFTLYSISAFPCSRVFSRIFFCRRVLFFISSTGTMPRITFLFLESPIRVVLTKISCRASSSSAGTSDVEPEAKYSSSESSSCLPLLRFNAAPAACTGTLNASLRMVFTRDHSRTVNKTRGMMKTRYFIVLKPSVGRPKATMIWLNTRLKYIFPTSHAHMDVPAEYCWM